MFQIAPCVMSILFWKFHANLFNHYSAMLPRGMDCSEKVGGKSRVQGVKWNLPKIFPIVPGIKSHLPWKFHENQFSRFFRNVANRPRNKQTSNGQRWKHNLRHGGVNNYYPYSNICSSKLCFSGFLPIFCVILLLLLTFFWLSGHCSMQQ